MIDKAGIYPDLPEADYHADPCPEPSLSNSIAKELVEKSPLHAWAMHPKFGGASRAPSSTLDHGSLVHELLLGRGPGITVVEANDWRTKAAKAARDEARDAGKTPVLAKAFLAAKKAAKALEAGLANRGVVFDGESEVTLVWQELAAAGPIWCRARLDHLKRPIIYDLKTTGIAETRAIERLIVNMGYDMQRAAYVRGLTALEPDLGGRVDFVFAFVETEFPYAINVAPLDGMLREYGERRWLDAVERWSSALRVNREARAADPSAPRSAGFHGYHNQGRFEAPGWLLARMEG